MNALCVSPDRNEITLGGKGGLYTWRVSAQQTEEGTRAVLMPMPARSHPPAATGAPAEAEKGEPPASVQRSGGARCCPRRRR